MAASGEDAKSALHEALAFRAAYGFGVDPESVGRVERDPSSNRAFGVALTEAEVQELERRERITQGLEPLTRALDAFPAFAGLYFDQRAGGVVDIAIAGDASLPSSVLSLAPSEANVRLRSVQHTVRELQALHEEVADDVKNWSAKGISINVVGVDVPSNSVRIEVSNLTDAARRDLVDTYGTRISVVEGEGYTFAACVSRNNCAAPLKGGLVITAANGPICTSGFVGRPTDPPITPVLRLLTAGHCIDVGAGGSGLGINWSHNGVVIGDAKFERLYNNTSADVGGILMTENGARNKVYATDSLDIRSVTGKWTSAQQPQGATVCRGGRTSGWFCAQISSPDQTVTVQGITLKHTWIWGHASAGGDSGAYFINALTPTKAAGILSAGNSTTTLYSIIDWVEFETGYRPCYTAGCF